MKTKILSLLLVFAMLAGFVSCGNKNNSGQTAQITYVYGDGRENKVENVNSAEYTRPTDPSRENYKFIGWCTDAELSNFYDFSRELKGNLTLYARWEIDFHKLNDDISKNALSATVKITSTFTDYSNLLSPSRHQSQGSGVVYDRRGSSYYILTNYHVVNIEERFNTSSHKVYDTKGNEYSAELIASDRNYDLAILKVTVDGKNEAVFGALNIEKNLPAPTATVVSIGAPDGRYNAVSYGNLVAYRSVEVDDASNSNSVSFDVLWHNCYSSNGSSGGALLNENGDIIGINFAIGSTQSSLSYTFAIPSEKVIEFLMAKDSAYALK